MATLFAVPSVDRVYVHPSGGFRSSPLIFWENRRRGGTGSRDYDKTLYVMCGSIALPGHQTAKIMMLFAVSGRSSSSRDIEHDRPEKNIPRSSLAVGNNNQPTNHPIMAMAMAHGPLSHLFHQLLVARGVYCSAFGCGELLFCCLGGRGAGF